MIDSKQELLEQVWNPDDSLLLIFRLHTSSVIRHRFTSFMRLFDACRPEDGVNHHPHEKRAVRLWLEQDLFQIYGVVDEALFTDELTYFLGNVMKSGYAHDIDSASIADAIKKSHTLLLLMDDASLDDILIKIWNPSHYSLLFYDSAPGSRTEILLPDTKQETDSLLDTYISNDWNIDLCPHKRIYGKAVTEDNLICYYLGEIIIVEPWNDLDTVLLSQAISESKDLLRTFLLRIHE